MTHWAGLLLAVIAQAGPDLKSPWSVQPSGTTERLRGVSAVSDTIAWASGNHGTCLRTTDGGATWRKVAAADAAGLDFRDVEAFDGDRAYALAIGPGEASRVFKSTRLASGEVALLECYRNKDPKGFLDAIAFWDHDHGLALGDPVDGRFVILATDDAGRSWTQLSDPGTMPPALPNEGAFAASGTCLVVGEDGHAWFATGGAAKARVFRSRDKGRSWAVAETPTRSGEPSRGIFGLAFLGDRGIAVGGDYRSPRDSFDSPSITSDGGATWTLVQNQTPQLYSWRFCSAVAFLPESPKLCLAIGPNVTQIGPAEPAAIWKTMAVDEAFHALAVAPSGRTAWAVGEGGKIGRMDVPALIKGR